MAVYETFDSRIRTAEKAGQPDIYQYDDLPPFLRRQLNQIFTACIGPGARHQPYSDDLPPNNNAKWDQMAMILDREIETFHQQLSGSTSRERCEAYLDTSHHIRGILSLVEIACRVIGSMAKWERHRLAMVGVTQAPDGGVAEVNARFVNHSVGYQFEGQHIIRIDSQYVHAEVVKPALALLGGSEFATADDEFRLAHDHYRSGRLRDCNTAALRCMETVLKVICDARSWTFDKGATVEKLVSVVRANGLFPDYLGGYFDNLVGAMKAGLPKIRDKDGSHGASPDDEPVPDHVAGFALHLAAANIVMLVQAYRKLPRLPTR